MFRKLLLHKAFTRIKNIRSLFIVIVIVSSTMSLSAQERVITLDFRDARLSEIFSSLKKDYRYSFFSHENVNLSETRASLNIRNGSIQDFIDELSTNSGLKIQLMEDNFLVISDPNTIMPQVSYIVSGKVTDEVSGVGLPGVSVVIQGTYNGITSDPDGNFSISAPDGNTVLEFSFIGYKKTVIPLNGISTINLALEEEISHLEEVVVTALNINRDKNSLGYSVTTVSNEDIGVAIENNPINSLAGKVSGLSVSSSPSGVDGSSRVILRGVASLASGNRPLIVIDGIPVDGGSYGNPSKWGGLDRGDALSDLNPDDIESMSVLKGAGAAAAYGSRGSNGVIIIRTKKGSARKGIGVSVNSNFVVETPMMLPILQDEYGQGSFGRYPTEVVPSVAHKKGEEPWIWSWGPKMEGQMFPDWTGEERPYSATPNPFKEFYQTGISAINSVAFEGGDYTSNFRASLTNQNSEGRYPGNSMDKQTVNLRGVSKLGKRMEIDAKLVYIHNKVKNRPYLAEDTGNAGWSLSTLPRNISLESIRENMLNSEGNENWVWDRTVGNPYWIKEYKRNDDEKHRVQGVFSLKYDITDRLNLVLRSGLDYTNRNWKSYVAGGSTNNYSYRGGMSQAFDSKYELNTDFLLSYDQPMNDDISLTMSLGGNHRYNQYKSISQSGSAWRIENFYHMSNLQNYGTGEYFSEKEVLSVYGLGQLSYKNFAYIDLTYRNDWSSTLPAESNSYNFYSGNLSFLFTEAFDISSHLLSKGKLRASYAKIGNDTGPYQTTNYYGVSQSQLPYPIGSMSGSLAFQDFRPEITTSWEIGTELSFLGNLIDLELVYYDGSSKNQIMSVLLAPSTGFSTMKQNAGEIRNKGFEGLIGSTIFSSPNGLTWNTSLNFSKNISEVVSLSDGENRKVLEIAVSEFAFVEIRPGNPFGEIFGRDYATDENGNRLVNDEGSPIPSEYKKLGDINPDLVGGFMNQLKFKNFSLSFLIDFQIGGEFYSQSLLYRDLMGTSITSVEGRDEWYETHEGTYYTQNKPGVIPKGYVEEGVNVNTGLPNDIPVEPMMRAVNVLWFGKIVSDYVVDASNIRLRELIIGYDLPAKVVERTPFTKARLSLTGRNLFFFYNGAKYIDPESGYNSGSIGNAFEMNSMPTARTIGFNLSLNF